MLQFYGDNRQLQLQFSINFFYDFFIAYKKLNVW